MSFFNKKEDVLEVALTPHGRYLLSVGKLQPMYYAFMDDDIVYDVTAASGSSSEANYQVKDRILTETPSLKPQTTFVNLDSRLISGEMNPTSDVIKYNHYTIGTSNNIEDFTPAWEVSMIRNEISSSATYLSSSQGNHNIPQLDVEIEYTISIGNVNEEQDALGLAPSPDLQVGEAFNDGTYLKVDPEQALFRILEKNGFLHSESLTIEAFKYDLIDTDKLIPLKFSKEKELIVNDILVDSEEIEREEFGPFDVEYFFDLRVDKQIPLNDICEGIKELKGNGITGDFEVECPDIGNNLDVNIYTSPITEEDIEDCE